MWRWPEKPTARFLENQAAFALMNTASEIHVLAMKLPRAHASNLQAICFEAWQPTPLRKMSWATMSSAMSRNCVTTRSGLSPWQHSPTKPGTEPMNLQRKIETTKNTKVHENHRVEARLPFTL
jgi:hypothetical protein